MNKNYIILFALSAVFLLSGLLPTLSAQENNLIRNPGFERTLSRDNLWDGVDSSGNIKFIPRVKNIMIQGGGEQPRSFSPSISYEDLDGDGLPDLVVADPTGFYYFFKNLGPREDPKFATGEMIPIFFTNNEDTINTPKIALAKWAGNQFDIIFGDYLGRIVRVPNTGTAQRPEFKMPTDITNFDLSTAKRSLEIPTRPDGKLWGNFFAPVVYDWNGDGKKDLLIGEGTYSANSIHLMLNEGNDNDPRFSEKGTMVLAYGYGREQLVPQVYDWDGDGIMDLIIGSREGIDGQPGTLAFYKGRAIPRGASRVPQLEFTDNIKIGGQVYNTPMAAPSVVDFNGNGLPDILIASPTEGRIKISLNKGTKTEPNLAALTNVKAVDSLTRFKAASGWADSADVSSVGNLTPQNQYAIVEVVDNQTDQNTNPPEGKNALKVHFPRPDLKVFQNNWLVQPADRKITITPANISMILGKNYELSFKVRGKNMSGTLELSSSIPVDEVPRQNDPKIFDTINGDTTSGIKNFNPSGSWSTVSFSINLPVPQPTRPGFIYTKNKTGREKFEYKGNAVPVNFVITVVGQGELYFDDFKLIEK